MSLFHSLDFRSLKDVDWRLLAVRTYTLVRSMFDLLSKQTVKSTRYLITSFADETYYFMDGCYIPVSQANLANYKGSLGVATVDFSYKYVRDINTIYSLEHSGRGTQVHTPNILEAKLMFGDRVLYDMTDFFDNVDFVSVKDGDFPPVLAWLSFFTVESGVVLDPKADLRLQVTTFEDTDEMFQVWNPSNIELAKWKAINTPLTLHRQPEVPVDDSEAVHLVQNTSNAGIVAPSSTPVPEEQPVSELPAPTETLERQETTLLASPVAPQEESAPPEN